MSRKSDQEWNDLIVEAARSGLSVSQFCEERGLTKNQFYRKTARYGFTSGGKRTEKWEAAARGGCPAPVPCRLQGDRRIRRVRRLPCHSQGIRRGDQKRGLP